MEASQVTKELAEEIRTNTKLRHRLGMSEGADSDILEEDGTEIGIRPDSGEVFLIKVEQG
jgi:hypothetical protein